MSIVKSTHLSGAVWGVMFVGFGYLFEYLNRFVIAKYLSIDSLGYFFTGISLAYLVMSLSLMGMPNEYSRKKGGGEEISLISVYALFAITFSIINIAILVINIDFYTKWSGFFLFSLVLGFYRLSIVRYSILGDRKSGLFFQEVLNRGGRLLSVVIAVVIGKEYFELQIGYVLAGIFTLIVAMMLVHHHKKYSLEKYVSAGEIKTLFWSSLPLSMGIISQISAGRIEFIIPEMIGGVTLNSLGVFAIYFTLAQFVVLPSMILTFSLTPKVARLYSQRRYKHIRSEIKKISLIIAILSFSLMVFFSFFHESIIHKLFDKSFVTWGSTEVFIFLLGYWLYAISTPFINLLLGVGAYSNYTVSTVVTALTRIFLIVLFLQKNLGIDGMIYASFLSFLLMFIILYYTSYKLITQKGYRPS